MKDVERIGAVVLYRGRAGIAQEVYEEVTLGRAIVTFRYLQISLPRLEATDYVQAQRVLAAGLVGTMHVPPERAAQIAVYLAGLRRVHQARLRGEIDEARAFLLVNPALFHHTEREMGCARRLQRAYVLQVDGL